MKFIVDTHILLWYFLGDDKLSKTVKDIMLNRDNRILVSIVSLWEAAIKINLKKLDFPGGVQGFLNAIYADDFELIREIKPDYLFELERMPAIHKDPFDRMLIAAALVEKAPLLTCDSNIHLYPINYIW